MAAGGLDLTDLRILEEIQKDGRISVVELSRRVHLTKTPCAERLRRLEKTGVICGYFAKLNPMVVNAGHIVMVQVQLKGTTADDLEAFNTAVVRAPEIQSCHMVAGGFDYLLKVRSKDIDAYRKILGEVISKLPGVLQTHTYVVMETVKDEVTLPVASARTW
ncbi:proline dehydrogenase transcriptional activator [Phyllobacterium phragmitis]|uniref:Proline dehydrogenase transcriptional activator n=1 Tax=Phyllobacterium phragmitis TaxID=2670329 RepID=A0A2S9IQS9_9HYPH|nr:Lrp/AsnC ligand binding domain-containing protein [Phyllobacterium phragmitis]PRD42875.1 proline dehydrogenase transcriptional activator [Phyllobacterium phragmitis]